MYAIDNLSDAIDVTRDFLTPFDLWMWVKLAIVVFFIAGMGFGNPASFGGDFSSVTEIEDEGEPAEEVDADVEELTGLTEGELVGIVLFVVALVVLLVILFAIVGALMEFVFIESLRSMEVHVRRYSKENLWRALHLLGFRFVVSILFGIVGIIGVVVIALLTIGTLEELAAVSIGLMIGGILLAIGYYMLYAVVMRLTTEFVAPIMLLEERGILSAWKRFWPTLTGSWKEYLVYVILIAIVQIALGIAVGILALIAGVIVAIPVLILAAIPFFVLGGTPGIVLAAGVGIVGFLVWLLLASLFEVPVLAYVRYYALLLLGDTNTDLDLVPDQRARARAAATGSGAGGPGGSGGQGDLDRPESAWDRDDRDDSDEGGWDNSSGSDWDREESDRDGGENGWDSDDTDDDRGWGNRDDDRR